MNDDVLECADWPAFVAWYGADPANGSADEREAALRVIQRWVERGDGVAVYRCRELGRTSAPFRTTVSYGSAQSQIPTEARVPPTALPVNVPLQWSYSREAVLLRKHPEETDGHS
jgi:hypothetical protein